MAFKMRGFPAQGVSALKNKIKEDKFDVDKLADADDQKFLDEQREERVTEEDKELYRLQQAKKEGVTMFVGDNKPVYPKGHEKYEKWMDKYITEGYKLKPR